MPSVTVLATEKLSVLVLLVLAALNCAVTPAGRPETARFTTPENPLLPATVMMLEPEPPVVSPRLPVEVDSEKLGVATATVTEADPLKLPETPLMVSG